MSIPAGAKQVIDLQIETDPEFVSPAQAEQLTRNLHKSLSLDDGVSITQEEVDLPEGAKAGGILPAAHFAVEYLTNPHTVSFITITLIEWVKHARLHSAKLLINGTHIELNSANPDGLSVALRELLEAGHKLDGA